MIYLLQTTCYAALLFGIYLLLIRNRAAHAWSRTWLLVCSVLPFLLPFIKVPGVQSAFVERTGIYNIELPGIIVSGNIAAPGATGFAWLPLAYAGICALLLGRIAAQYFWFARMVRQHKPDIIDDVKVLHNTGMEPGSFGRYIFLPDATTDKAIVQHELTHIKLYHSADIMLMRLLQAIFWPNVMLCVIARELRLVHEFQADAYSAGDKAQYTATLLNSTFHTRHFSLSHTFFHHPLKRRIMMLQKPAPGRNGARAIALRTCGMAAVLLAGIVWLQSCQQKDQQPSPVSPQALTVEESKAVDAIVNKVADSMGTGRNNVYAYKDQKGELKIEVDKKSPGNPPADQTGSNNEAMKQAVCSVDLMQYLAGNIKYPESAKNNNISGKVVISFTVDENGDVRDVEVKNKVSPELDAEAVRVVSQMPHWQPAEKNGKKVTTSLCIPIVFRL